MQEKLPFAKKPERIRQKKFMTGVITIGLIGLFAYLATLNPSQAMTDEYLKQEVYDSKQELIDTDIYESSIGQVPREIRSGVIRNTFRHELVDRGGLTENWDGTASIVDQYTDADMNVHWIQLTNAHIIPEVHYPLEVDQPTHHFDITDWDCTPIDYLGSDPASVDPTSPITDLAICDLNTGLSAEELPSTVSPINLELFQPPAQADLEPTSEVLIYGYPANPHSINWEFLSEIGFVTTMRPTSDIKDHEGLIWYEGGKFGPGGSGSPGLIIESDGTPRISTIFGAYKGDDTLFPLLHQPTGPLPRTYYHGATPLPADIREKVKQYVNLRQNGQLPVFPTPQNQWWQQH